MRHLSAAIVVLLVWAAISSAQSATPRPDDAGKAEEEIARIVGYAMTRGGASAFLETLTDTVGGRITRSEEHTSELQSQSNLVCRLLLEKKKYTPHTIQ